MNTTITADTARTLTNRALVIAKALLQDVYVEMTARYQRHGWQSGTEAYNQEKLEIANTIKVINNELHTRYERDQEMNKSLEEARLQTHAAVVAV
jgi:hypothetical protein